MLALEGVATSEEPTVQQNMKYVGRLDAPRVRGVSYIRLNQLILKNINGLPPFLGRDTLR